MVQRRARIFTMNRPSAQSTCFTPSGEAASISALTRLPEAS